MGVDAESTDLSERIRERAAAEHPPIPIPVPATTAPVVVAPATPTEWGARRAAFDRRRDELMAEGMSRDAAEEQADSDLRQTPPPAAAPRAGERAVGGAPVPATPATKQKTPERLADLERRLALAESGITRVSDRLSAVEESVSQLAGKTAAYMTDMDAALELLARQIVERTAPPPSIYAGGRDSAGRPYRMEGYFHEDGSRCPDTVHDCPPSPPAPKYSFWRSRAGKFISAPARALRAGVLWLVSENEPFEYEEL